MPNCHIRKITVLIARVTNIIQHILGVDIFDDPYEYQDQPLSW